MNIYISIHTKRRTQSYSHHRQILALFAVRVGGYAGGGGGGGNDVVHF